MDQARGKPKARERKQPVRRLLWGLIRLIPDPVRLFLWERILELPGPIRRLFWSGVVRKDRQRFDFTVPDNELSSQSEVERRRRWPKPQQFDVIVLQNDTIGSPPHLPIDLARGIARLGHRVFWIGTGSDENVSGELRTIEEGIYAYDIRRVQDQTMHAAAAPIEPASAPSWTTLRFDHHVIDAVCLTPSSSSPILTSGLRRRFGWKIISADLIAENNGHSTGPPAELTKIDDCSHRGETADLDLTALVDSDADATASAILAASSALFPRVSIVVVTYNGVDYNRLCLGSIFDKTAYPDFEVIVVDNGSTDGTREYLQDVKRAHPNLRLILNETNEGYTRGTNQGAAVATGDYLVFLNNDTIVTRSWLSRLVYYLEDSSIGLVGPTSSWPGNESGIETSYTTLGELHAFADKYARDHEGRTYDARRIIFFCAAIRRTVWEEIGPLDERFSKGSSFEDDDYTMRVRERGFRLIYAEDAFVHHRGMGSSSRRDVKAQWTLLQENRRLFEEKWGVKWDPERVMTPHGKPKPSEVRVDQSL